jgi:PilZ domain
MTETRIAPRYRFDKRAIAEYGGDKYPCTVRDISVTGAAIEFPDPVSLLPFAKDFNLIIKDDGLKLACRIVWRRDTGWELRSLKIDKP